MPMRTCSRRASRPASSGGGVPAHNRATMRIRPNRATLEGEVLAIRRCADGVGADVELRVVATPTRGRPQDCTGAHPGQTMTLFAAVPEALRSGGCYRFEVSVLGGPQGERVVVESATPSRAPKSRPPAP